MTSPNHSPESVLNSDFQPVKNLLEQQISDGLHPGAQLCVEIAGTVVADFAVGEAIVDSGINLTNNSIMPLFSSAKPVTAVAIGILVDSGELISTMLSRRTFRSSLHMGNPESRSVT